MPDGASGRSGLQAGSRAGPPLSLSTLEARRGPAGAPARARDTEDLSKPPAGGGASVRRGRGRVRAEVTRSRLPRRSDWDCGAGRPRLRGGGVGGHLSDGARAPRGGGGMFLGPGPGERRQEAQARAAGEPGGEGRPGHGTAGVGRGGRRDADSALPAPVPSRALTRRGRGPGLRLGRRLPPPKTQSPRLLPCLILHCSYPFPKLCLCPSILHLLAAPLLPSPRAHFLLLGITTQASS